MNREGIVESKWKTRGSREGQSGEDTLQVVLSIKVFFVRKMEVVEALEDIKIN